jgi:hypothetical protein
MPSTRAFDPHFLTKSSGLLPMPPAAAARRPIPPHAARPAARGRPRRPPPAPALTLDPGPTSRPPPSSGCHHLHAQSPSRSRTVADSSASGRWLLRAQSRLLRTHSSPPPRAIADSSVPGRCLVRARSPTPPASRPPAFAPKVTVPHPGLQLFLFIYFSCLSRVNKWELLLW